MKKLFLLLALLGMVAVGCSKDDTDKGNDNKTEQPNENEGGNENDDDEKPVFEIDAEGSYTIPAEGAEIKVTITTNLEYRVEVSEDAKAWLSIGDTRAVRTETLVFTASKNESDRERTATITIFNKDDEKIFEFSLIQKFNDKEEIPENIFFGIDKESATIAPDGGSVDVIVYSNYKWEISGTSDWCTPSVKGGDANEDGQKVTFSADMTYDDREATFWFRCADKQIKFVVSQKLKEVIIPDANNTFNFPAEGGVAVISYQTSVDCEVIIPEEAQSWITIAPASRGLVSENINLDIAENTTYDSRSAVIKVVAKDNAELVVEYTINQVQNDAVIADENNVFTVPGPGSEVVIKYQTNIDCEIIIPDDAQDWITIVPETRGLVAQSATLHIAENTTYDSRSAVIKVVAKDNAELVVEYTINQEPNDAILADENNTFTVPSEGGNIVIDYQTNVDCEIIVPTNAQSWITILPETRSLVAQSATLHIAENTTYSSRSAVIKVVAKDNAELVVEYTINQVQNDAILADDNNTFTVPSEGGNIVIDYQTNVDCEIIVPTNAQSWITILPATRGLVAQSATLHIAENMTGSARTATIKVVAKDNSKLVVEYTISQEQNDAILADDNNAFTVPGSGGEVVIKYQTNVDCEIIIPEEAQDWITIAPATRGLVVYNTTLNIAANYSNKQRSCVVKVVSRDYNELFAEYTITQNLMYYLCYTSSNGNIVQPNNSSAFGAIILSNTYKDGFGIIEFNAPITKIGDSAFSHCDSLTSVTIPDSVTTIGNWAFGNCSSLTSITIPDSVTSIGKYAFCDCSSLTSVTIPDSVTEIGKYTFYKCSSLTSITIPDSVTTIGDWAFCGCSSLTSVTIPDSVTTIGNWAFGNCSSLTSVTVGDSVTSIGECAFSGCSSLTSITIPDSVTSIGNSAFSGCPGELIVNSKIVETNYSSQPGWLSGAKFTQLTIGNGIEKIGSCAFNGCSSLTSVTIPDSVTAIGYAAFSDCTGELIVNCNIPESAFNGSKFTSVTIGDGVTTIGDNAFYDCDRLTSVTIGDSVTTIGKHAFDYCSSLTSVTIPDSVTTIGEWAFWYCSSLTSVTIGDSVTTIRRYAFDGCRNLTSITIPDSVTTIGYRAFYGCSSLTSVTIPDSVTAIGNSAFSGCTGELVVNCNIPSASSSSYGAFYDSKFTSVTIGDGVTTIGDYAFSGCSSLTSVTIPDSVTTIGNGAFQYCDSLTSVTISDSVTTIGEDAFYYCRSLTSVTIGSGVTTIGKNAFSGCTGELIVNCNVPSSSYDAFYDSEFTSVTIGDSVTSIGDSAFNSCSSLTSVTIGDSVTSIGYEAFTRCSSLTSVTIPDSVTTIGNGAFQYCDSLTSVTIPDSVTTIGEDAFYYCCSLTSVTIGSGVTTIGKNAFSGCTGELIVNCNVSSSSYDAFYDSEFTSVTIGDSVTSIGDYAFWCCSSLTSVTIGDSVTTIGDSAFNSCSSLTSVTIGDSVTTIGDSAFQDCSNLTSVYISDIVAWCNISYSAPSSNPLSNGCNLYLNNELVTDLTIPDSVTTIGNGAFYNCRSLTSVTIGDSVTTIGDRAFVVCDSLREFNGKYASEDGRCLIIDGTLNSFAPAGLTEYTIPDSITTIGNYAFYDCDSLTSVTIPDSVTTIGDEAFSFCSSLTSVTIPDSVTEIGWYAFYRCESLTSVYCKAITPPAGGSYMFSDNASGRKIYVPMESVEAYKSASYWSSYSYYIEGYNF